MSDKNDKDKNEKIDDEEKFDFSMMNEVEIETLNIDEVEDIDDFGVLEEFKEKFLDTNIQERIPMLFRLTRRGVVFLSLLMWGLFLMCILGNFQKFLDSDLNLILFLTTSVSILLALMSAAAIIECIFCAIIIRKIRYIFYSVFFIIDLAFAAVIAVFSRSVNMISLGAIF